MCLLQPSSTSTSQMRKQSQRSLPEVRPLGSRPRCWILIGVLDPSLRPSRTCRASLILGKLQRKPRMVFWNLLAEPGEEHLARRGLWGAVSAGAPRAKRWRGGLVTWWSVLGHCRYAGPSTPQGVAVSPALLCPHLFAQPADESLQLLMKTQAVWKGPGDGSVPPCWPAVAGGGPHQPRWPPQG